MRTLERVLLDAQADAEALRRNGHAAQAETAERIVAAVREAAEPFLDWITEGAARLRSGRGDDYFKARRETWAEQGLAERRGRHWWYRRCVIEHRKPVSLSRGEARRSA